MRTGRSLYWTIFTLAGVAVGCGSVGALAWIAGSVGGDRPTFQARARALDLPELWSIEDVSAPAGWRAVRICADAPMRSGFIRPAAAVGAEPCLALGAPVEAPGRIAQTCQVRGQVIGQSASYSGDLRREFSTTFTYVNLAQGVTTAGPLAYSQTLRFRRLGACPPGWRVGEHTDRHGRRHAEARVNRDRADAALIP